METTLNITTNLPDEVREPTTVTPARADPGGSVTVNRAVGVTVWRPCGITATTSVLDREGRVKLVWPFGTSGDDMAADLAQLLKSGS